MPVLIAAVLGWQRFATRGKAIDSVAVLPFANVDDDPRMAYLSDNLTESLIDGLSPLPALRVSARSTIAGYKGHEIDPRQVGRELQLRALVMGRVLWQGDRLIIRVQLVDTADGSRLWGDEFRRGHSKAKPQQCEHSAPTWPCAEPTGAAPGSHRPGESIPSPDLDRYAARVARVYLCARRSARRSSETATRAEDAGTRPAALFHPRLSGVGREGAGLRLVA